MEKARPCGYAARRRFSQQRKVFGDADSTANGQDLEKTDTQGTLVQKEPQALTKDSRAMSGAPSQFSPARQHYRTGATQH